MIVKEREIEEAVSHWAGVASLLTEIVDEADYDRRVEIMEKLLDRASDLESGPHAELASRIGDLIEAYDEKHRPLPSSGGAEVLRYLMTEQGLKQSDLPEVGTQSVVSEILAGKRRLNWKQICGLAQRFGVATDVFRDNELHA